MGGAPRGPAEPGRARASDRGAVFDFCARLYPGGDYVRDTWDSWMREGCLRAVREGDRPVGVCGVSVRGGEAWLEGLRVDPRMHRRGVGSALMRGALDEARSRGAKTARMFAEKGNPAALRLAERCGFKRAGVWTWYRLSGGGGRPRPAPAVPLRGLALDSWRAYSGAGEPLFLQGASCAVAPSEHFAGTLMVTVVQASDLSGLAGYLRLRAQEWPARRMSGWVSGVHVASALDAVLFTEFFEPVSRFDLLFSEL